MVIVNNVSIVAALRNSIKTKYYVNRMKAVQCSLLARLLVTGYEGGEECRDETQTRANNIQATSL